MKKPGRSVRPMVCSIPEEPLASAPPIGRAAEGIACISLPVSRFKNCAVSYRCMCGSSRRPWRRCLTPDRAEFSRHTGTATHAVVRNSQFLKRLTGREIQAIPSAALPMGGADARGSSGIEQTMGLSLIHIFPDLNKPCRRIHPQTHGRVLPLYPQIQPVHFPAACGCSSHAQTQYCRSQRSPLS